MPSMLATYIPAPTIRVAGQAPTGLLDQLIALTVEETVDGLARCELSADNWGSTNAGPGYLYADRSTFDFGTTIEVAIGPPDERATIFAGKVSGLEAAYSASTGATVTVLAEDALQGLRMTRRTRTFDKVSDADLVTQIATDHGLTPDVDLEGPTHSAVCQLNQSDLAFVRDRVLPLGADVWLDGTTLHVGSRQDDPIVLRYGHELLDLRVLADLAMQATEQRVAGWDVSAKDAVLEVAGESSLGSDLGTDLGGAGLVSRAFGDRPATTTLQTVTGAEEARVLAVGLYRERARRFVTGTGTVDGIAVLRAGRSVTLSGLGTMFDGTYRLCRVVHRYHRVTGYRTDIAVERMGIGQ